jgi:hypothetical protein
MITSVRVKIRQHSNLQYVGVKAAFLKAEPKPAVRVANMLNVQEMRVSDATEERERTV